MEEKVRNNIDELFLSILGSARRLEKKSVDKKCAHLIGYAHCANDMGLISPDEVFIIFEVTHEVKCGLRKKLED